MGFCHMSGKQSRRKLKAKWQLLSLLPQLLHPCFRQLVRVRHLLPWTCDRTLLHHPVFKSRFLGTNWSRLPLHKHLGGNPGSNLGTPCGPVYDVSGHVKLRYLFSSKSRCIWHSSSEILPTICVKSCTNGRWNLRTDGFRITICTPFGWNFGGKKFWTFIILLLGKCQLTYWIHWDMCKINKQFMKKNKNKI